MDEEIDRSALPIRRQRLAGAATRTLGLGNPSTFGGKINRVVFDINPHLTEADRQVMYEHEQRAALAHGIGA